MADELPPNFDIYAFLSIPPTATVAEVRKAYRKHSLLYHPDKNSDPSAVEKFHYLNLAYDILTSPAARAAYDNVRKARAAKAERTAKYDDERRRMQRDLESREQDAKRRKLEKGRNVDVEEDINLREAVEKLKEESARLKKERDRKLAEDLAKQQDDKEDEVDESERTLKIRFRKGTNRESLSTEKLEGIFSEFGTIQNVILGKSALIVFDDLAGAKKALTKVSQSNVSQLSFIKEVTMAKIVSPEIDPSRETEELPHEKAPTTKPVISTIPASKPTKFSFKPPSATGNDADYESITLMRMRKIERERLEKEILEQEEKEDRESVLVL